MWEAYQRQYHPSLIAVARPHHLINAGESAVLDGSRSWSKEGPLQSFRWKLTDGQTAEGAQVLHRYERPGTYSEILEVSDNSGRREYDFAVVQVHDPSNPSLTPPTIHAAYHPTLGVRPGDEVTFKVRSFGIKAPEETWDFGDGTPPVTVRSDGNANIHDPKGYAVTMHSFAKPGIYVVRVERTSSGYPAVAHLQVQVGMSNTSSSD